jgi:KUP system potassium uptake protein
LLGAIGIVFGDIGTSPLYTLKECTSGAGGTAPENVLGVLSLIFWALMLVVTIKYLVFIMRADNHGEGGILALLALVPERSDSKVRVGWLSLLVIAGAALLYGDGIITPAISVLSAMEGLEVATDALKPLVVPLTCGVLVALFAIQRRGTSRVGRIFGPVMVLWFLTIAGLGLKGIVQHPEVLNALSPIHGVRYFVRHGLPGMTILGSVVLAVTGGEALYADMGHFGAQPIRRAWLGLVLPALVICYFGQGALLLADPGLQSNPFFAMVPGGFWTYALVALASAATVIASQALISGAFSLTHQAVQLGFFPRVEVRHTSRATEGQIYVPLINWGLAIACLALVLGFRESSKLAAAYGIAVSGTMAITSVVYSVVARRTWGWPLHYSGLLLLFFLSFDLPFFGANALKFLDGGYVPVLVAAAILAVMVNWKIGRSVLAEVVAGLGPPIETFLSGLGSHLPADTLRVPGTAIFLSSIPSRVPPVLMHQLQRIHALHQRVVLLTISIEHVPVVRPETRLCAEDLGQGFHRVVARYGFMERPDVPQLLRTADPPLVSPEELAGATYYIARETFLATPAGKMGRVSESFFAFLARNARSASLHFGLPPNQVLEIGQQIDL